MAPFTDASHTLVYKKIDLGYLFIHSFVNCIIISGNLHREMNGEKSI